jgi:hypothetical protein
MFDEADVMVVGVGDLGGWIVELLARAPGIEHKRILVASRSDTARKRAYSAWTGASFMGRGPKIKFTRLNLFDVDKTGELLTKYRPKVICHCATLQPWWIVNEISPEIWTQIETGAGFGPWGPIHLTLIYKLMQAIAKYEIESLVVNCCFPDFTNPVLHRAGHAITCGIGNGDLVIPGIKKGVAEKLRIPENDVTTYLVMHHSHVAQFMTSGTSGTPYYIKIMAGDRDTTSQFDVDKLILNGIKDWLPGRHTHPMTASAAVKTVYHLLFDTEELCFAPGPNGEVGGYPVRLSQSGARIVLPDGITLDKARKINQNAQKKDGIDKIEADGTVIFTDAAHAVMKEFLDYDCKTLKIEDSEERSRELLFRYEKLKKKYGQEKVNL